jgi:hypothetical protein
MRTCFDTVTSYLNHAEETRVIASGMKDAGCRRALEKVADDWESMAAQATRIALVKEGLKL